MKQFRVGILLFDDVDALDFAGPYEVFNLSTYNDLDVKKLYINLLNPDDKPFLVNTVSEDGKSIRVHNGLIVHPDFSFQNAPVFDLIVVPGGPLNAIKIVQSNQNVVNWIKSYGKFKFVASVCTGSFFLAKAGLLSGKSATTNKSAVDLFEKSFPDTMVLRGPKFVDEGNVVTSSGISAGINMALHVVEKFFGKRMAKRTAETLEFTHDY